MEDVEPGELPWAYIIFQYPARLLSELKLAFQTVCVKSLTPPPRKFAIITSTYTRNADEEEPSTFEYFLK